jgi:diguanylate cyclase (GGDEF)-like protein
VTVLQRLVALEPSEKNFLRLGELCSQAGDKPVAASAFLKLAEMTEASGSDAAKWYERAYTEDSTDIRIALGYGKSLVTQGEIGAAIFVLEPLAKADGAPLEIIESYAKALLSANRLSDAEPLVWQLFQKNPSRLQEVANLVGLLVDAQQDAEAVALARKLEQFQRSRGDRRAFVAMMQEVAGQHRSSPELLEFMSELFNASNREGDYSQTLLKLFDLHCGMGNYAKAAECLDRAADVDAYEPGHQKRLEMLRGKIDENRFKVIASRFTSMAKAPEPSKTEGPTLGAAALQDLMLQAEILVQYGMRSKAIERLQRIQELFPGEEERNQDLQQLYLAAGVNPQRADNAPARASAAAAAKPASKTQAAAPPVQTEAAAPAESTDVNSFTKVAEITRKLYRQTNSDAVMSTAVNEIGAQWKLSRCLVAMRKPGMATSAAKEFAGEGVKRSENRSLNQLIAFVQDLVISLGTLSISNAAMAPELDEIRGLVSDLGIISMLALPLSDGEDQTGVLLLVQNTIRNWNSGDIVVLKTISEQIVIALNNAGLRRLVKSLSVTDEQSGLLKRASYLDLLMAETRRAVQQSTPLTVALVQFGKSSAMLKQHGEQAVEAAMQKIGQIFAANIRQNDLAFRYEMTTIALVLGETLEKEALAAVEKLRKLLVDVKLSDELLPFSAGLAEAVVRQQFDPVDIVTEVINRADMAMDMAVAQGMGRIVSLAPSAAAAAVA